MADAHGNRCYRWLLFDADGTLFDFHAAEASALAQAFGKTGLAYEPDHLQVYRRINSETWRLLEQGLITAEALKVRRFELFFETVGLQHSAEIFSQEYLGCLAGCADLIEGAREVLQRLHRQYRIGILTNGLGAVQRPRLAASLIRDYVADIVISEEIGFAKPDPRYFETAFERLGRPEKPTVLFIGDSWTSDIAGGVRFGIDTCWFNPKGESRPAEPRIVHEVRSLLQLEEWLKQESRSGGARDCTQQGPV